MDFVDHLIALVPLFFFPGCLCCGAPDPTCSACATPSNLSQCHEVVVAGVTDSSCTSCTNYNKTYTMYYEPNYDTVDLGGGICFWTEADTFSGCEQPASGCGTADNVGYVRLFPSGFGDYRASFALSQYISPTSFPGPTFWDRTPIDDEAGLCEPTSQDVDLNTSSSCCSNWPATVTIAPVSCP